jgi:RNA polymerase sigma factor (sigma-70 family)
MIVLGLTTHGTSSAGDDADAPMAVDAASTLHAARRSASGSPASDRSPAAMDDVRVEDAALLQRVRDRDERAIEVLYDRFGSALYSLACRVTRNERAAQDIVQEVFVAVWKDAGRWDPSKGTLSSWLFSLARHKSIDHVRRETIIRRRTADVDPELEPSSMDVDQEAWLRIRRDRLREAIGALPDAQRTALELAFFGGLTHPEVAERLGIPLGTAKTRIRTALLTLRAILGPSLSETEPSEPRWITGRTAS